jgi:hypothetical protein
MPPPVIGVPALSTSLRKTRRPTSSRTSLFFPFVACSTGMRTPPSKTVTATVTIAARLGAALRLSALSPSPMKKKTRPIDGA